MCVYVLITWGLQSTEKQCQSAVPCTSGACVTPGCILQVSSSAAVLKAGPPPVQAPAMLSSAELEKPVCIRLEETETVWLLNLPGGCINADTGEGKAVETANAK